MSDFLEGLATIGRIFFDGGEMWAAMPQLLKVGLPNTLLLTVGAFTIAVVFGLVLAMARMSRFWVISAPTRLFVDAWRALPAILKILLVGLGLPLAGIAPFGTNSFPYAMIAVGMINAAYICEILRSGIQSVDRGQREAALSLGVPDRTAMRFIIVPQGIRRVLPAMMNQFVITLKETSLVFMLGLSVGQREIFAIGQERAALTGNLSGLTAAGLIYLALVIPLARLVDALDARFREARSEVLDEDAQEIIGEGVLSTPERRTS